LQEDAKTIDETEKTLNEKIAQLSQIIQEKAISLDIHPIEQIHAQFFKQVHEGVAVYQEMLKLHKCLHSDKNLRISKNSGRNSTHCSSRFADRSEAMMNEKRRPKPNVRTIRDSHDRRYHESPLGII